MIDNYVLFCLFLTYVSMYLCGNCAPLLIYDSIHLLEEITHIIEK